MITNQSRAARIQILIDAATDVLRSDQHDRYPINCPSVSSDNIKVYSPTQDVFRDFEKLVTMMEGTSGRKQGVAKILVPQEWYVYYSEIVIAHFYASVEH